MKVCDAMTRDVRVASPGDSIPLVCQDWANDPFSKGGWMHHRPGNLTQAAPLMRQPHGRIHFAGAYADNLDWGMEAATRSANRVAEAIHKG